MELFASLQHCALIHRHAYTRYTCQRGSWGGAEGAEVCRHCGSKGSAIKWFCKSARSKDSPVGKDGSLVRCHVLLCVICVFFFLFNCCRVFCAKGYPVWEEHCKFRLYAAGVWNINLFEIHVPIPKHMKCVEFVGLFYSLTLLHVLKYRQVSYLLFSCFIY